MDGKPQPSRSYTPNYYINTPQGQVFETLRLLAEYHDDVEEVARIRGETVQTVLTRLRSNNIKILAPEELLRNHYEKAKKVAEEVGYDKDAICEKLKISIFTLNNWLKGGPVLPFLERRRGRKPWKVKEIKQRIKEKRRKKKERSHKFRKTHPIESGLDRLKFMPGVPIVSRVDVVPLMDKYASVRGDKVAEEEVMQEFFPYLKKVCNMRAWKLGAEAPDLLYHSYVALRDILSGYTPGAGTNPSAWLARMMYNRMTDQFRIEDPVSRLIKGRRSELYKALEIFDHNPTDEEIIDTLGWTPDMLRELRESWVMSLDEPASESEMRGYSRMDSLAAKHDDSVELSEMAEHILRAAYPSEREVLSLYYLEGLTMKEVGEKLGLSESRISQMMSGIIERLRERLCD